MSVIFRKRRILRSGCQGAILICVLACLVIITSMVTATIRSALRSHLEVRQQRNLRQAELILEAGILRARQQVLADPDYKGEVWQLAVDTIPGTDSATIEIATQPAVEARQINVTARLGEDSHRRIQRTYTFTFDPTYASNKE
ncbi:hypothetical protein [Bythopirellula polymerisocia]|uniref:Type II secretion system protein I n=1 Tax=Bythopirellula polymerisocia TaxID=2528003 RepID=A0A5C6CSY3_9BACT|nr:hypothetical protein [Bythopirellula polymerisocia]TWU28053.1 hypothetical protein Pla144_13400 [Bythopirellula polymerisocia]